MIDTPLTIKANIMKSIRSFFYEHNFQEVMTPSLVQSVPLEPTLSYFSTFWNSCGQKKPLYLTASPESTLKKFLASEKKNCFSIAPSFRNVEEANVTHMPEFLLLEWYEVNKTYRDEIERTDELIQYIQQKNPHYIRMPQSKSISMIPMSTLWKRHVGITFESLMKEKDMITFAQKKGYETRNATWEQLFNQIFLNEIEPHIGMDPYYITEFPAKISPLCKPNEKNPHLADRFELYSLGMEIANGNTENTNKEQIKTVFEKEQTNRKRKGEKAPNIDNDFLHALDSLRTTNFAGVGLGIDRLIMALTGITDIRTLNPFF